MSKSMDGAQAAAKIAKHLNKGKFSTVDEVVARHPELAGGREYLEEALKKPPVSGSVLSSRF